MRIRSRCTIQVLIWLWTMKRTPRVSSVASSVSYQYHTVGLEDGVCITLRWEGGHFSRNQLYDCNAKDILKFENC